VPRRQGPELRALLIVDELWRHEFRTFGFPIGHDDGVWASGRLLAQQATVGAGSSRNLVAATWPAEHEPARRAAVQPPCERLCYRVGEWHQADAGVALGPVLVAGAEPAGVVAHLDNLDASPLLVHAAGAQAEQLAAAQPAPNVDDEVVAVEGRAGRQKSAELLGAEGPSRWIISIVAAVPVMIVASVTGRRGRPV
jgi:hypothetical protein